MVRVEIAKILLEHRADLDARDFKGFSATDFARKMNKKSILPLFNYDENAPKIWDMQDRLIEKTSLV